MLVVELLFLQQVINSNPKSLQNFRKAENVTCFSFFDLFCKDFRLKPLQNLKLTEISSFPRMRESNDKI